MVHITDLFGNTPEDSGKEIADMRYDAMAQVIDSLAQDLSEQAAGDIYSSRERLARIMSGAVFYLNCARQQIDAAWKISKPYMEPDAEQLEFDFGEKFSAAYDRH